MVIDLEDREPEFEDDRKVKLLMRKFACLSRLSPCMILGHCVFKSKLMITLL